ncbi:MAG: protein phosphatase 2C domain-containing protein [Syntrophales bacterium]
MISAWRSDTGKVRPNNEDHILVDEKRSIFLLADGLGGHPAGELASEMAVRVVHAFLLEELSKNAILDAISAILKEAFQISHRAIRTAAERERKLYGMGTTLVAAVILEGIAHICHAGDSRAYLYRNKLRRLTRDHTVAQDLMDQQGIQQARNHSWERNALTECLGMERPPLPAARSLPLQNDDVLLLCSDGLTDMLNDPEIERVMKQRGQRGNVPDEAVNGLVDLANMNGGADNISVILVYY